MGAMTDGDWSAVASNTWGVFQALPTGLQLLAGVVGSSVLFTGYKLVRGPVTAGAQALGRLVSKGWRKVRPAKAVVLANKAGAWPPVYPGQKVLFRTVTMYTCGMVSAVNGQWVELADAEWVANTGDWAEALKTFEFSESQKHPAGVKTCINMESVVDFHVQRQG